MAGMLSEEAIAEVKEAFSMFDKDGEGRISTKDLGEVMRFLGQNPTSSQLHHIIKKVDADKKGIIEEADFVDVVTRRMQDDAESADVVRDAFKLFDEEGKGFISCTQLKHLMTSMGDKLTDAEVQEMLLVADPEGHGRVDYDKFVSLIVKK